MKKYIFTLIAGLLIGLGTSIAAQQTRPPDIVTCDANLIVTEQYSLTGHWIPLTYESVKINESLIFEPGVFIWTTRYFEEPSRWRCSYDKNLVTIYNAKNQSFYFHYRRTQNLLLLNNRAYILEK